MNIIENLHQSSSSVAGSLVYSFFFSTTLTSSVSPYLLLEWLLKKDRMFYLVASSPRTYLVCEPASTITIGWAFLSVLMYLAKLSRCSFLAEISVNTNGFPSVSEYYFAASVKAAKRSLESSALNKIIAIFFEEKTSPMVLSSNGTTAGLWFLVSQFLSPSSRVS